MEFAPQCVNVFLLVIESSELHQMITSGRMSTVCTDEQVESRGYFGCPLLIMPEGIMLSRILRVVGFFGIAVLFKPSCLLIEVSTRQLMVEVQRDIWQLLQGVEEALVETCTVYRLDVLRSVRYLIRVLL